MGAPDLSRAAGWWLAVNFSYGLDVILRAATGVKALTTEDTEDTEVFCFSVSSVSSAVKDPSVKGLGGSFPAG
jgi:hypothetical protein